MKTDKQWDYSTFFEDLPTDELRKLLNDDLKAENEPLLSVDEILSICKVLAERDSEKPDPGAAWERFLMLIQNC